MAETDVTPLAQATAQAHPPPGTYSTPAPAEDAHAGGAWQALTRALGVELQGGIHRMAQAGKRIAAGR